MSILTTPTGYLKFKWSNDCDMNGFIYQDGFFHELYLEADVGKPRYSIEQEATEDVNGNQVFLKRKLDKTYNIHLLLRQHQLDALVFCSIHKYIEIYLPTGQMYNVRTMIVQEPVWDLCSAFAEVDIDFTLDPVIQTNCCTDVALFPEDNDLGDYIQLRYAIYIALGDMHEAVLPILCKSGSQLYIDWGDGYKQAIVAQNGINLLSHGYTGIGATMTYKIKIYGDIDHIYEVMTEDVSMGTTFNTNENVTDITVPEGCDSLSRYNLNKTSVTIPSDSSLALAGNIAVKKIEFRGNNFVTFFTMSNYPYLEILYGQNNKLSKASVNQILTLIDQFNVSTAVNRIINLSGGTNAAPDNSSGGCDGIASKAHLIANGWSVTTN